MGDGLSSEQCKGRWNKYLEPLKKGLKPGNWQSDEVPYCVTVTITLNSLHSLTYLFTCFYMAGAALAGAGATASDPIVLEHSDEGHDEAAHRLEGHRQEAG